MDIEQFKAGREAKLKNMARREKINRRMWRLRLFPLKEKLRKEVGEKINSMLENYSQFAVVYVVNKLKYNDDMMREVAREAEAKLIEAGLLNPKLGWVVASTFNGKKAIIIGSGYTRKAEPMTRFPFNEPAHSPDDYYLEDERGGQDEPEDRESFELNFTRDDE